MRFVTALGVGLLGACAATTATQRQGKLDASDVGVYDIVHRDGHLTDMRFRLVEGPERWKLEQKKPDGSWDDVTCEEHCLLVDSSYEDVKGFMNGEPPPGMWARCIHNTAFAFCRVTGPGAGDRRYTLVALTTANPTPIKLQRIE
jgi:hypothetical protein